MRPACESSAPPLRVVLVDDDPLDHPRLAGCLRRMPGLVHLRHAPTLAALEATVREAPADVVLVDLDLGRYRQLEVLEQLRHRDVDAPFVVVTASELDDRGPASLRLGAEDFLPRDCLESDYLWDVLTRACARYRGRRTRTPTGPEARRAGAVLHPGDIVDRYEVEALVGEGGMATVYRARHRALGSLHALKVVRPEIRIERGRVFLEGRLQARLRHPNLVEVTDLIEVGPSLALVMSYVAGPSLHEWLEEADDLRGATWLSIFRGVVRGVRCAHAAGIVHRDLKPGNVLLDTTHDGWSPRITDFGIAKVLDPTAGDRDVATPTGSGISMGTPGFMAPEQVYDAAHVDARADLFSLGCLLYFMVSGRRPFDDAEASSPLRAMLEGRSTPLGRWVEDLPPAVTDLSARLLAPHPEERPQDCQAILEALDGLRGHHVPDRVRPRAALPAQSTAGSEHGGAPRPARGVVVPFGWSPVLT